jgi:hypothetical protein
VPARIGWDVAAGVLGLNAAAALSLLAEGIGDPVKVGAVMALE